MPAAEVQLNGQLFFTIRGETERNYETQGLVARDKTWQLPLYVQTEDQRAALLLAYSGAVTELVFPTSEVRMVVVQPGDYPVYLPSQITVTVVEQVNT